MTFFVNVMPARGPGPVAPCTAESAADCGAKDRARHQPEVYQPEVYQPEVYQPTAHRRTGADC